MMIVDFTPEEFAPGLGKHKGLGRADVTKALRRVQKLRAQGKATKERLQHIFSNAGFDQDEIDYLIQLELGG